MGARVNRIERFEASGSHFEIGFAIGRRFAKQIHHLFDNYDLLGQKILPYHYSSEGRARYQKLLDLNQFRYPEYFSELEGLAKGAERSFEEVFLVNMRGEYRGYIHESLLESCFDCSLVTDDVALLGHNEDGTPAALNNMYLVHVRIPGRPAFTSLSYPGFLYSNAFGFNSEGILFSIDSLQPRKVRVGVGRHFIARSLLEARSINDAIERVTVPGRASGLSYTIASVHERRVVSVEVSPEKYHVHEVSDYYFHANHYQELSSIEQIVGLSSRTRMERAQSLHRSGLPSNAAAILALLGDREDEKYPIYRSAAPPDTNMTLCTALFDIDNRKLRIYTSHPVLVPEQFIELAL